MANGGKSKGEESLFSLREGNALSVPGGAREKRGSFTGRSLAREKSGNIMAQNSSTNQQIKSVAQKINKSYMIQSLITSQKQYVDKLDKLIKVFIRPLSDSSLTVKYRQTIFSNVKEFPRFNLENRVDNSRLKLLDIFLHEIYSVHVAMQSDLEFSSKQEVKDIVEIFVTNTDALQVHAEYSYQLPSSLQKLDEIKHNDPNVYRKITSGETPGLRIKELLSCVPDIIPTYISHIEEILKAPDRTSEDKTDLDKALSRLKDLSEHLEISIQDLEIKAKLTKLQQQITGVVWGRSILSKGFGRLLREDDLKVKRASASVQLEKLRHVILLEKILMITKPLKSGLYEFDQAIDLSKATMAGDVRAHIVRVERSEGGTAILTTNNKQDQKLWLDTLNSAKERLHPRDAVDDEHTFQLQTFSDLRHCDLCNLILKGAYSQGYFCNRTRKQVHFSCLEASRKQCHAPKSRLTEDITLDLPRSSINRDTDKLCFGGYFGRIMPHHATVPQDNTEYKTTTEIKMILLASVQRKLTLLKTGILKGGFRYIDLALHTVIPTCPQSFIMWETKSKGTKECNMPKAGFIECLYRALINKTQLLTLADVEEVTRQHQGQANTYTDTDTGEGYVAGYYQEIEDIVSSDDEDEKSNQSLACLIPSISLDNESMENIIKGQGSFHRAREPSFHRNSIQDKRKGAGKQTGAIGGVMLSPENQTFQPRRSHTTAPTLSVASNQPRRSSARYSNRSDASLLPKAKDKWK